MSRAPFRDPPERRKGSENESQNGAEKGPKMKQKKGPEGTETEIINKHNEESSYATTREDREGSGLFLGVHVEARQTSKPNSNSNSTPNFESEVGERPLGGKPRDLNPERHDDRTLLRELGTTRPRDPSLAELPLHSFPGALNHVFIKCRWSNCSCS